MASARDLKKQAAKKLDALMLSRGFRAGVGCSYFRVTDDGLYQIVMIIPQAQGSLAGVFLSCTIPQLHPLFSETKVPPKSISIDLEINDLLGKTGPYIGNWYASNLRTQKGMENFFEKLPSYIESLVFPYFDNINTKQKWWDSLPLQTRSLPRYLAVEAEVVSK